MLVADLEAAIAPVPTKHVCTAEPLTQGTAGGEETVYKQPRQAHAPLRGWSGSRPAHRERPGSPLHVTDTETECTGLSDLLRVSEPSVTRGPTGRAALW